ncbi:hypothetical protein MCNS_46770 [Mycobacterium conspicuum]|uniref:Cyclase n=1 Tax=Mycobacterium conspicuum TaxID=44010 RepID=A0A7I7YKA5_9MYCO|nr:hypothetical protein MCNS_46770 [Mycobacterium conspicuum]
MVTRLLRAGSGVTDLDPPAARAAVRTIVPTDVDPQDLLLLDDLLNIADPDVPLPQIDPDARRRRLTALVNATALARNRPALFIIEDAHWVDAVSESMLADFLAVIPRTSSMVLVTCRPEYRGALMRMHGAQTISLAPLADSDTATLLGELLGSDPTTTELAAIIAERAAGNPFFAEEMVRELVQRGVLAGDRGSYISHAGVDELSVPATVQAAIEARIDRLTDPAKRTLNAASVIGARFEADLLAALDSDPVVDELLAAELIDQVRFSPSAEYAFHHPLIRAVAYESQLKTDRAEWHRRVAAAIESRDPAAADENAAMIAEHLEVAGDLRAAYQWHMRAATWATPRDIAAARQSWERAEAISDALPEDATRTAMRIAPRTKLCGIAWRARVNVAGDRFDQLRELCALAGDKASLAIGMGGLVMDHALQGRIGEGSRLASEAMALVESIGDAALLAVAFASRAIARYCLGLPGWSGDLRHGLKMARSADPLSYATVATYVYFPGVSFGVLAADDSAVRDIEDALRVAERSGDDMALVYAQAALGTALVHRPTDAERSHGQKLLAKAGEAFLRRRHSLSELPLVNAYLARERARRGPRDEAVPLMFSAVEDMLSARDLLAWGYAIPAVGVLVEALLANANEADVVEAEATIERLAAAPADDSLVIRDIWLMRLRALLAAARGDNAAYRDLAQRYRAMAHSLEFEGHMAWADAMIADAQ